MSIISWVVSIAMKSEKASSPLSMRLLRRRTVVVVSWEEARHRAKPWRFPVVFGRHWFGSAVIDWLILVQLVLFFYTFQFRKSVPAVSRQGFMQGIQSPSWSGHTQTHTHNTYMSLLSLPYGFTYSTFTGLFSHSSFYYPSCLHAAVWNIPTNLAVRQISASHVKSQLHVHWIGLYHSISHRLPGFTSVPSLLSVGWAPTHLFS